MIKRNYATRSRDPSRTQKTAASSADSAADDDNCQVIVVDDDGTREENGVTSSSLGVDTASKEGCSAPEPESLNTETPPKDSASSTEGCSVHEPESLDTETPPKDSASSTKDHSLPESESLNTETPLEDSAADETIGEIHDKDDDNNNNDDNDLLEIREFPNLGAARTERCSVPEPESPNTESLTEDSAADVIMGEIHDHDDNNDGLAEVQAAPNHEFTDISDVPNISDVPDDSVVPEISDNLNNNSSHSSSILEADTKRKSPRRKRTKKKDEIEIFTVDGRRFRRVVQEGDGNCLFRSLVHALKIGGAAAPQCHKIVRSEVIDHCCVNWTRFGVQAKKHHEVTTKKEYESKLRKDGEWGDHTEVLLAADLYDTPIHIYNIQSRRFMVENPSDSDKKPIFLAFDYEEQHYDALEPMDGDISDVPMDTQ